MEGTSRASSKLLHGGLRYLENGEFRLVREALRERDAWIRRAPHLAWPIRLVLPIYRGAWRPRWMVALGLYAYDRIAGRTELPQATWLTSSELIDRDPKLRSQDLLGGYEFSDAQMDDYQLGLWAAEQAMHLGVKIREKANVDSVTLDGKLTVNGDTVCYEKIINVAGPWAQNLLERSGLTTPVQVRLVRGSHIVLASRTHQAYLMESPGSRRIFFVLPWQGKTLVGTTEREHLLKDQIRCSTSEQNELLTSYQFYFSGPTAEILETFSGLRPLVRNSASLSKNTREYAIHKDRSIVSVFGGKWTTAMALASKVAHSLG